jgi:recombination protein RecA
LIEPDEEDSVEEAQVEETSDELVLDLDSTIEIEE